MVWDDNRAVNWKGWPYIYIYIIYIKTRIHIHRHMRWINKTWQTHTDTHTQTLPKKLQTLQTFLDPRFKILGETSWIQALTVIQGPMSVSVWIQTRFPQSWIVNLESQKNANFANCPGPINKRYVRGIVVCSRSMKWYPSRNIKGVVNDIFNDIYKIPMIYQLE